MTDLIFLPPVKQELLRGTFLGFMGIVVDWIYDVKTGILCGLLCDSHCLVVRLSLIWPVPFVEHMKAAI